MIDFNLQVERNLKGIELERAGEVEKAIELYEANISEEFEGNHPYDRLAIIYRKYGRIDDEIRVLQEAIQVFRINVNEHRMDREPKLENFKKRLDKALSLKESGKMTEVDVVHKVEIRSRAVSKGMEILKKYGGVNLNQFYMKKGQLCEQFHKEPSDMDVIWGLFNEIILGNAKAGKIPPASLYYEMAVLATEEGGNPLAALKGYYTLILRDFKNRGIRSVRIVAVDCCDECKKNEGKVLDIDQALSERPIPNPRCNHRLNDKFHPLCCCQYVPVIK
jgi:tetratricopeptide (TPR) repeat protein